jgi:hypothetical protein
MNLEKPVVAYTADSNYDAHLIVEFLRNKGVTAFAVEDQSLAGVWGLGTLPQIHKPQVWVEEADLDRATVELTSFEHERQEIRHPSNTVLGNVNVTCEDCGKETTFPASLEGTVQVCSHCHAYVDVGDMPDLEEGIVEGDFEDEAEPSE